MNRPSKLIFLTAISIICSISLYLNVGNDLHGFTQHLFEVQVQPMSYSCDVSKNVSHIDIPKYEECIKHAPDESFWPTQSIRHTAFKNKLNSSSLIIEVGGNIGFDASQFIALYNSSLISFEPLTSMSKALVKKFKANPNVEIRPYGLGNRARNITIERHAKANEGSSLFRKASSNDPSKLEQIQVLDVINVIADIQQSRTQTNMIDMISINCEGCEFEILPALILNDMTRYFRIIQFASHTNLVAGSSCIYCHIEQELEKTHTVLYRYTMLWEAWISKDA